MANSRFGYVMHPVFSSNRQALGFCALILAGLLSPLALRSIGYVPRPEVYWGITKEAGLYPFLGHQVFEEHEALDIAIVGSSLLLKGVDAPLLQVDLSRALGRPAKVELLAAYWQGMDMQYALLRDLLEHRHVGMVIMSMPIPQFNSNRPHVQAFRWLRFGEERDAIAGLPLASRTTLYADAVLGTPRQFLSLLRPNEIDPRRAVSSTLGSEYDRAGYYGAPFLRERIDAPHPATWTMIYSGASHHLFDFHGPPLPPYQQHWVREIGKLLREHHTPLTLLHVNDSEERGDLVVHERMFWPDLMQMPMLIVGVPTQTLFAKVPEDRFYNYFFDQHMNLNGKELFTTTINPALIKAYVEVQH